MHTGESTRTSMVSSRTSFAAFFADGRASDMGGVPGSHAGPRASVLSSSLMLSASGSRTPVVGARPTLTPQEAAAAAERQREAETRRATARLPGILQRLALAERAVLLNSHQAQVAAYRNVQVCVSDQSGSNRLSEAEVSGGEDAAKPPPVAPQPSRVLAGSQSSLAWQPGPDLQLLWTWAPRELTAEMPVTCLAWNCAAPDLLAVGYGRPESAAVSSHEGGGLLAVYSLRNPVAPHWYAPTPCGVSALDFGPAHAAGTLAAGFYDGSLALYDVCAGGGGCARPLARAPPAGGDGSGGHADAVWQLRYVGRGSPGSSGVSSRDADEALFSISSDGLLAEWKLGQGLERLEVVRLKRQAGSSSGAHDCGNGLGRQHLLGAHAGGTCFDFCPSDPRTYLVGTDEGGLHRRSTAFADAPGQNYEGHVGVLYRVRKSCFATRTDATVKPLTLPC